MSGEGLFEVACSDCESRLRGPFPFEDVAADIRLAVDNSPVSVCEECGAGEDGEPFCQVRETRTDAGENESGDESEPEEAPEDVKRPPAPDTSTNITPDVETAMDNGPESVCSAPASEKRRGRVIRRMRGVSMDFVDELLVDLRRVSERIHDREEVHRPGVSKDFIAKLITGDGTVRLREMDPDVTDDDLNRLAAKWLGEKRCGHCDGDGLIVDARGTGKRRCDPCEGTGALSYRPEVDGPDPDAPDYLGDRAATLRLFEALPGTFTVMDADAGGEVVCEAVMTSDNTYGFEVRHASGDGNLWAWEDCARGLLMTVVYLDEHGIDPDA